MNEQETSEDIIAKMREALEATPELFFDIHNAKRSPQFNQAYAVIRQIKTALAAPPREKGSRTLRKLKASDCAILHLVLKSKWYDLIASGEKQEEYRDAKPYWNKRILKWRAQQATDWAKIDTSKFLEVALSRGYRLPGMFFLVSRCCIYDAIDHPTWGEPDTPHWVIGLGDRVVIE